MPVDITQAQPHVWQRLLRIHRTGHLGSAYLFAGPRGSGKEATAIRFATLLNCEHPGDDACGACSTCIRFRSLQHVHLNLVVPLPVSRKGTDEDRKSRTGDKELEFLTTAIQEKAKDPFYKIQVPRATRIRIESIRKLRKTLYLKSHEEGQKIVLIFDAHLMSTGQGESANALLKILEEPPDKTTLILVSDHKGDLLPTILSRCQQVDFPPLESPVVQAYLEETGHSPDEARLVSSLSQGDLHRAHSLSRQPLEDVITEIKGLAMDIIQEEGTSWRKSIQILADLATADPEEFRFRISQLQLWFRSAYRQRMGLKDDLHVKGMIGPLESFNQDFPQADLHRIHLRLESALAALARSRYMPLTLTNMFIGIQEALVGD